VGWNNREVLESCGNVSSVYNLGKYRVLNLRDLTVYVGHKISKIIINPATLRTNFSLVLQYNRIAVNKVLLLYIIVVIKLFIKTFTILKSVRTSI
jgi:hypothetical protein